MTAFTPPKAVTLSERREGLHHYTVDDFQDIGLLNDKGKPRLNRAIGYFRDNKNDELLMEFYGFWRDFHEYIVLRRSHVDPKTYSLNWEYLALKCSKRGNDVHSRRVRNRLDWLKKVENIEFFNANDFHVNKKVITSLLWVTLTYDTSRCSRMDAWLNIGVEFSRFMHLLRKKHGRISALRVWESFENGYPHVHVCLFFHESRFSVFPHLSMREGRFSFRIHRKAEIAELWHSHVDVEAISSMKKLGSYVRKYQMKVYEGNNPKSLKTMAFCWIFRKRSFALSGSFREALHDLICCLRNWAMKMVQSDLFGNTLDEGVWEFVGVFSGKALRIHASFWAIRLKKAQISVVQESYG
jgi:hypothetical protein